MREHEDFLNISGNTNYSYTTNTYIGIIIKIQIRMRKHVYIRIMYSYNFATNCKFYIFQHQLGNFREILTILTKINTF
jgi:hypothetical protein